MTVEEYIGEKALRDAVNRGYVTKRSHNTLPLDIYSYSRKTVRENVWDDVTRRTRGLIVEQKTGQIIARPYEKFFGYNDSNDLSTLPEIVEQVDKDFGPPIITEKVNGCLGIFWRYGIHWGIATKGSFHSPHAEWATKWLEGHVEHHGKLVFPEGYTPVFEIICQEVQPHTIPYDNNELVLLDFINNETGEELQGRTVEYSNKNNLSLKYTFGITLDEAVVDDSSLMEGYVITYPIPGQAPFKLKVKFPTFLKNRRAFYEELNRKKEPTNEQEYKQIHEWSGHLLLEALKQYTTRKEIADFLTRPDNVFYAPVCFAMLDERKYEKIIWGLVEKRLRFNGDLEG